MIRYILVDDMPKVLENVKSKIDTISKDYQLSHVNSYDSSKKAFEEINKDDYDLLIVDFEMPVYNGIELAKKIGKDKKIIFLTGSNNNEQKVINNLDISGYLSKPFDLDEFESILKNKVIGKINKTNSFSNTKDLVTLHIGSNKDLRFTPEQVYYISTSRINIDKETTHQPSKNCVNFYGENDIVLHKNVRKSINDLNNELEKYNFGKISKSTIINMGHVKERDNTNVSLFGSKQPFEVKNSEKQSLISKLRARFNF